MAKYVKKHSFVNYDYNLIDLNNSNTFNDNNKNPIRIFQIILVEKKLESTLHKISSFQKTLDLEMFDLYLKITRDSSDKSYFSNKSNVLAKMVTVKLLFIQNIVINISSLDYYNSNCFDKDKNLHLSLNNEKKNNNVTSLQKTDIFNKEINIFYQTKGEFYIILTKDKEIEDNNYAFFLNNRSNSNSYYYNKDFGLRSDYDTIGNLEVYYTNQNDLLDIISKNLKPGDNYYKDKYYTTTNGVNIDLTKDNTNLLLRNMLSNYIINSKSIYIPLKDIMKLNVDNKSNNKYNNILFFKYTSIEEDIYSAYTCKIIDNTTDKTHIINLSQSYIFDFKNNKSNIIKVKINNNNNEYYVLIIDIIYIKQIIDKNNFSYNLKIYSVNNKSFGKYYNTLIDDINSNNYYNKYYNKEIKIPIYNNNINNLTLELNEIEQSISNFDKDKYFHDIDSNMIVKIVLLTNNNNNNNNISLNNIKTSNIDLDFDQTYNHLIDSKKNESNNYYNDNLPDEILNIKIIGHNLFKSFSYYILVNPIDINYLNEVPDNFHSFTDNGIISLQDIGIFKFLRQKRSKSINNKYIANIKEEYVNNKIYIIFKLNSNKDMYIKNNDYKFGIKTVNKATMTIRNDTYNCLYNSIDKYNSIKKIVFNNNIFRYSLVRKSEFEDKLIIYFYFYNKKLKDLDDLIIKVFDNINNIAHSSNNIKIKKHISINIDNEFYNRNIRLYLKSSKTVNIYLSTFFINNKDYIECFDNCSNYLDSPIVKNTNNIYEYNYTISYYTISWKPYYYKSNNANKFKERILYFVFINESLIDLDQLLDDNNYDKKHDSKL